MLIGLSPQQVEFLDGLSQKIWAELQTLADEEQRQAVCEEFRFGWPAFFHLLGEKSLEEGKKNRERGIELAQVALDFIETSGASLGPELPALRALGFARLGNARCLACDLPGAEADLARAEQIIAKHPHQAVRQAEPEVVSLKASLRVCQRRFAEARQLLNRAVALSRRFSNHTVLVRALIQRAGLTDYIGDHEASVCDLTMAAQLVHENDEASLALAIYANLAVSYTWAGNHEKALAIIPRAEALSQKLGDRLVQHQLQWIRGLATLAQGDSKSAEDFFCEARAGFIALSELGYAAVAAVDLAALYHRQGRGSEVVKVAAEAIPTLEGIQMFPDAIAALELLRREVAASHISFEALNAVRASLHSMHRDPTAPLNASKLLRAGR